MLNSFLHKGKESSVLFEKEPHRPHRNSSERHCLDPLMDEEGTNETRYYRSAEFQQALLEDQIARRLTPPAEPAEQQDNGRMSKYLNRRSTLRSSKSSLALFDLEEERAKHAAETETPPPPAYDAVVQPPNQEPSEESVTTEPSESNANTLAPAPMKASRRASVYLKGIAPRLSFVGKKDREKERT